MVGGGGGLQTTTAVSPSSWRRGRREGEEGLKSLFAKKENKRLRRRSRRDENILGGRGTPELSPGAPLSPELLWRRFLLCPSLMAWRKCIDPADPCRAARNKY